MTQKALKNPKIRFKQANGANYPDWQVKSLGEVMFFKRGYDLSQKERKKGKYPVVASTGIIDTHNDFKVKAPNVIIGRSGSIGGGQYIDQDCWALNTTLYVQNFHGNNEKYCFYLIQGITFTRFNSGGAVPTLNRNDLHLLKIRIPHPDEQKKIAGFLSVVDKRIENLQGQYDMLSTYKQGIMQQIFTQKIRFTQSNGTPYPDWQTVRLGDIKNIKFLKGQGLSKNVIIDNGQYECILYGELFTTYKEITKNVVSRTNQTSKIKSIKGDILIPTSTTTTAIDLATATVIDKDHVLLGGDINIIRAGTNINPLFISYGIRYIWKQQIRKLAQGITIIHLYNNNLKELKINLPHPDEQKQIADFLSAIDRKITTLNTQLTQTKTYKKSLMQKMFV